MCVLPRCFSARPSVLPPAHIAEPGAQWPPRVANAIKALALLSSGVCLCAQSKRKRCTLDHVLRTLRELLALGAHCAALALLDCTGLRLLTDEAMLAVAAGCPQLHSLLLSWAVQPTDAGVCAVARRCPLRLLSVHGLRGISGATVDALAEHCAPSLTALDVRGCLHVEDKAPAQLQRRLPRLHPQLRQLLRLSHRAAPRPRACAPRGDRPPASAPLPPGERRRPGP